MIDPDLLTEALVELEERHMFATPECANDTCDHDQCPEYVIGCKDGKELAEIYNQLAPIEYPDPDYSG